MSSSSTEFAPSLPPAYAAGVYKDEVVPREVEEPVFDDERNRVEDEVGKTVTFDQDECIRAGTTADRLGSERHLAKEPPGLQ